MMGCKIAIKKPLVYIWNKYWDIYIATKDLLYFVKDVLYSYFVDPPNIVGIKETLLYILETKCSVCRYGDGEMKFIIGDETWFQKTSPRLKQELTDILRCNDKNIIVCIPDKFTRTKKYTSFENIHWNRNISYTRKMWYKYLDMNKIYYDSFISRCYMPYIDKSLAPELFSIWKKIWERRNLLIIEGEKTRLGVGNNLFDNVISIKRILCPNTNAFKYIDLILDKVTEYDKSFLILVALGPTATVLSYHLARKGYQSIDIGHLDIEYEWYLMGAQTKVPVYNKFVNEAGAGKGVGENTDRKYLDQIVYRFS